MKKVLVSLLIIGSLVFLGLKNSNITGQTVSEKTVFDADFKSPLTIVICSQKIKLEPFEKNGIGLNKNHEIFVKKTINTKNPPTLKQFFNSAGIRLTPYCIGPHCAGDPCPSNPTADLKMLVNGVVNKEYDSHPLIKEEIIQIRFE